LIAKSLEDLGWHAPIVTDMNGEISIGHGRYLAAMSLKLKKVPVLRLNDDQIKKYRRMVLDNRSSEFSEWDVDEMKFIHQYIEDDYDIMRLDEIYDPPVDDDPFINDDDDGPTSDENDISEDNPKLLNFIEQREKSRAQGKDKTERNFWICVVFQSYDQKIEFLSNLNDLETKYGMYIDGEEFSDKIGVKIQKNEIKPSIPKIEKKLSDMVK
jgi:hypothetical protein